MTENTKPVLFAFGDSIVRGHTCPTANCVTILGQVEGYEPHNFARNGATILPSELTRPDLGGHILRQLDEVPADAPAPDIILFDGGTNDAFPENIPARLGEVTPDDTHDESAFDGDTFAGNFELTVAAMRAKWPEARIIYLAVAKLGARDMDVQQAIRDVALAACCKWGVAVADVFGRSGLDTRRDDERVAYSFDADGSDGLPGTPETIEYPDPATQPTGTHPNIPAIERFYLPILRETARAALAE